jgi:lysozyme
MTPDAREHLLRHLVVDEGVVLHAYQDHLGYWTIGGGISHEEALYLLENDVQRTWDALTKRWPWVLRLDPVRQAVLVNMAFNMGVPGLAKFVNTLGAVQRGAFSTAANGMRRSLWYRQVQRSRSERLIAMMITGQWPGEPVD